MENPHTHKVNKAPPNYNLEELSLVLASSLTELVTAGSDRVEQASTQQAIRMLGELGKIQVQQQQTASRIETINRKFESLVASNELLEQASTQNLLLTEQHYIEHVIDPMVRLLFPVIDNVYDMCHARREVIGGEADPVASFSESIWIQVKQFLKHYDVDIVWHPSKSPFDPKIMRPMKKQTTHLREQDGLVAQCLQVGFKRGEGKLLRHETVSLYQHSPTSLDSITSNERN